MKEQEPLLESTEHDDEVESTERASRSLDGGLEASNNIKDDEEDEDDDDDDEAEETKSTGYLFLLTLGIGG